MPPKRCFFVIFLKKCSKFLLNVIYNINIGIFNKITKKLGIYINFLKSFKLRIEELVIDEER